MIKTIIPITIKLTLSNAKFTPIGAIDTPCIYNIIINVSDLVIIIPNKEYINVLMNTKIRQLNKSKNK